MTEVYCSDLECPWCNRPSSPLGKPSPGEGGWYSRLSPEPIEVIEAWRTPYHIGAAIKYLARWEHKGGIEDLRKAVWFVERFIKLMEARDDDPPSTIQK